MQIVKNAVETPYKKVVFEYLSDVLYKKNIKSKLKYETIPYNNFA
jgi:hypothetical protein